MKIELKKIPVRDLVDGYQDNGEGGVRGYGGKLDIRPPYQREFIYKDKQRNAVINTIVEEFPLNVMYWAVRDDGSYEIIDGQQRTISICQFVHEIFTFKDRYFNNIHEDEQKQILDYKISVYFCEGTDSEKLEWFKIINIAGEKLKKQELRNAVYAGSWVANAKSYFSRSNGSAYDIGNSYITGHPIRQDYLETAIKWISNGNIEDYMAQHQHDQNASALWRYFQDVISWVEATFVVKREKFMRGVDWGSLYNLFKDNIYDQNEIEKAVATLIKDDDVTKKKGIYPYILTGDEKYLSIRAFTDAMKQKVYERQDGICNKCGEHFELDKMEADHIVPWYEGGKTLEENCQMLCRECNRRKSGK